MKIKNTTSVIQPGLNSHSNKMAMDQNGFKYLFECESWEGDLYKQTSDVQSCCWAGYGVGITTAIE